MPSLPVVSGMQARRVLELLGWQFTRHNGSHMVMTKPGNFNTISIPKHDTLDRGLLKKQVLNKANLTVDEFIDLLDRI